MVRLQVVRHYTARCRAVHHPSCGPPLHVTYVHAVGMSRGLHGVGDPEQLMYDLHISVVEYLALYSHTLLVLCIAVVLLWMIVLAGIA